MPDVVVAGASLSGLVAAWKLAEGGADVAIHEARPHWGSGPSGQQIGLVDSCLHEHPWRTAASLGTSDAAELFRFAHRGLDLLESWGHLDRCGLPWIPMDDREAPQMAQSAEVLNAMGLPAEVRDGDWGRPVLFLPRDGRIKPMALLDWLVEQAVASGVQLHLDSAVRLADNEGDALVLARDTGDPVRTEVLVTAAGWQSAAVDPILAPVLGTVREQAQERQSSLTSSARAGQGWTWWSGDGTTLRIGGCRWATPHMEVGETKARTSDRVQERISAFAEGPLQQTASIDRQWGWIACTTRDGLPLIGPVAGSARRVLCTGFHGSLALSAAAGAAIAQGLLTGQHGVPERLSPRTRCM